MILNAHYNFVFLHIPKAAGSSLAAAFRQLPGNLDWPARTKHETLADFEHRWPQLARRDDGGPIPAPSDFYTIAFVRNPWDRMASFYRYLVEHRPRPEIDQIASFEEFLCQARDGVIWINGLHSMRPQLEFVTGRDGRLRADFVGHYEFLAEDLAAIGERLGFSLSLPHVNASSNTRRDYRDSYTTRTADLVAERFPHDVARFGYRFDEPEPGRRMSGSLVSNITAEPLAAE